MTDNDAQRELEQRALRNVRGLVDRIEDTDQLEARKQRRLVIWLLVGAAVLAVAFAVAISLKPRAPQIVIDPGKLPPATGGPQQPR